LVIYEVFTWEQKVHKLTAIYFKQNKKMQKSMHRRLKTENTFSVKMNYSNKILEWQFSHIWLESF